MRTDFLTLVLLMCSIVADAQPSPESYGVDHNMPVFFKELKSQLTFPLSFQHSIRDSGWTFNRWRIEARKAIERTMQTAPPAPKDYSYEVLGEEHHEGYKTQLIAFNVNAWEKVKAYLLVPRSKFHSSKVSSSKLQSSNGFPAILLLHDHGAHFSIGKEKMVRPLSSDTLAMKDAENWITKCYDGVFVGDEYAKQGYVVLCTDALLWGDRGGTGIKDFKKLGSQEARYLGFTGTKEEKQKIYNVQEALAANMLQMGTSWGAWITWDDIRSAAFLSHLPIVDKNKVGCLGFSMGAYRSWMLAALSEDIKASASVCWMNDTEHLMTLANNQTKGGSAYSMIVPGIRHLMDYPDVAALSCPKPALFFNGTKDKLFPVQGVGISYNTINAVYASQDAFQNLVTKLWDENHFFNKSMQKEVLDFFNQKLKK